MELLTFFINIIQVLDIEHKITKKDERKKFDTQFKKAESNFKIAIVVDPAPASLMGFDVPFLDTICSDKPVRGKTEVKSFTELGHRSGSGR